MQPPQILLPTPGVRTNTFGWITLTKVSKRHSPHFPQPTDRLSRLLVPLKTSRPDVSKTRDKMTFHEFYRARP